MSLASTKKQIRERFNNRCADCGMANSEHVAKAGRSIDIHRLEAGSKYTVNGCVLLCKWCHRYRHGAEKVVVKGTGRPHRGNTKQISFRLPVETIANLNFIAKRLHATYGVRPTASAALAYAIKDAIKTLGLEAKPC